MGDGKRAPYICAFCWKALYWSEKKSAQHKLLLLLAPECCWRGNQVRFVWGNQRFIDALLGRHVQAVKRIFFFYFTDLLCASKANFWTNYSPEHNNRISEMAQKIWNSFTWNNNTWYIQTESKMARLCYKHRCSGSFAPPFNYVSFNTNYFWWKGGFLLAANGWDRHLRVWSPHHARSEVG